MKSFECISCGKKTNSKDEIGINLKLLGEDSTQLYCLSCLADYLGCSIQDLMDKVEEFKNDGCRLFK